MKRLKLSSISASLLLVAGCFGLWYWAHRRNHERIVSGGSYTGRIIGSQRGWAPSEQDVAMMEKDFENLIRIDPRIQGSRLAMQAPRYWRYYTGVLKDGRREIEVSFLSKDYVTRSDWLGHGGLRVVVCGGGESFWDLTYDVQKRQFVLITHNADM